MKWLVSITLRGKRDYSGHDIFFEKVWDRDGAREGFFERFLYWKLCITPWEVANTVFVLTEWERFPLFCRLFSFLYCGLVICKLAYLSYLKMLSGAAANSEILFYN